MSLPFCFFKCLALKKKSRSYIATRVDMFKSHGNEINEPWRRMMMEMFCNFLLFINSNHMESVRASGREANNKINGKLYF